MCREVSYRHHQPEIVVINAQARRSPPDDSDTGLLFFRITMIFLSVVCLALFIATKHPAFLAASIITLISAFTPEIGYLLARIDWSYLVWDSYSYSSSAPRYHHRYHQLSPRHDVNINHIHVHSAPPSYGATSFSTPQTAPISLGNPYSQSYASSALPPPVASSSWSAPEPVVDVNERAPLGGRRLTTDPTERSVLGARAESVDS